MRLRDQRPRDGSPLLLPAGHLVWVLFQQLCDAKHLRDRQKLFAHLRIRCVREHERQIDIVLKGKCVQQVKVLKDKPQILPAKPRDLILGDLRNVLSVYKYGAARGLIQRREDIEQRGLS